MANTSKRGRKAKPQPQPRRKALVPSGGERFELAMRAINEGVYDWDVVNGSIYYSEAVYSVLHMPRSVKTPGGWRKRIHPDDLAAYDAAIIAHFKKKTRRFECDYRYRARDRTWRWARQHGIAQRDARGRVVRMIGSTGDITELKRVELALAESRERYALATWAATEGIYEWNLATGALFLSDRAKAFFGVKSAKPTPAAWNARVHRDDFPGYRAALAAYFKGRTRQFEHEYRIRNTKGGYAWVIDRAAAVRDAGDKVVRLVGALADVSQRKLAEIELRRARDEATAALERQTATAEILKVISSSTTDTQPVLDAIARSATRLFEQCFTGIVMREGDQLILRSLVGSSNVDPEAVARMYPMRFDPEASLVAEAISECRVVEVPDSEAPGVLAAVRAMGKAVGYRSLTIAPLMREGVGIGAIAISSPQVGFRLSDKQLSLLKTFADQAVIAIENVRLFNETKEALERQTATAEILKVIASSPSSVQPVFDAIASNAMQLIGGFSAAVVRVEGDLLQLAALTTTSGSGDAALKEIFPVPISGQNRLSMAVRDRAPRITTDIETDPEVSETVRAAVRARGWRAGIAVPMLRDGQAVGAINVTRRDPGAFGDHHVKLLQTFADQAVIAIENVRLFNETREALERQTATAEILRVIASSPSDVQPVFDAIAASAKRLLDGGAALVARRSGDMLHLAGFTSTGEAGDAALRTFYPARIVGEGHLGKAILSGQPILISDIETESGYTESFRALARTRGLRSVVSVPMLCEGEAIGVISVNRPVPGKFSDHQTNLLRTFASQAVIAIQNVRLFNETKEALERQTATAEILKVIASSPSDVQPVFDAIVRNANSLMGGFSATLTLVGDGKLNLVAYTSTTGRGDESVKKFFPVPVEGTSMGRVVHSRTSHVIADLETDAESTEDSREMARARGFRSVVFVPLTRNDVAIGTLNVTRRDPGAFTDHQIGLLKTFADQAVIAIQNVRLFNETREALERQTATADILRVIASTPTDTRPVFSAIVDASHRLIAGKRGGILLRDGDHFVALAFNFDGFEKIPEKIRRVPLDRQTNFPSRAILDGEVVHIPDWQAADIPEFEKRWGQYYGVNSGVIVPLLRKGESIGALVVARERAGPYGEKEIALLRSFADQAVIAIENVRLFNETKESLERQTATAEILKVIASSPSDVQPVFDAIAASAMRLLGGWSSAVARVIGDTVHLAAHTATSEEGSTALKGLFPRPLASAPGIWGMVIKSRRQESWSDVQSDPRATPEVREVARSRGFRSALAVPMLRDGVVIGAISISRAEPGPFTDHQINLLQTFADQGVIAIENVRLFNETREALERQTATGEVLAAMSGSMTDTQPVFEKIVQSLRRLFGTRFTVLQLLRDGVVEMPAVDGVGIERLRERYPRPLDESTGGGRAMLTKQAVQYAPVLDNPETPLATIQFAKDFGFNSVIFTPMIHEGRVVGAIGAAHTDAKPFDERQIALIKTFAAQAVIAIENVRLFNETREALERQTATGEILKVIASSPSDVQPVFDAIVASAVSLFGRRAIVRTLAADGQLLLRAHRSISAGDNVGAVPSLPLDRDSTAGRAILERKALQVVDLKASDAPPFALARAEKLGYRSIAAAPLISEDKAIGVIAVTATEPGALSNKQLDLLQTFADQAVIAIQNVRLFNETKEALERQTATAEILKVMAGSPSDVQPVFDAIAGSALRLIGGRSAYVMLRVADELHLVALTATSKSGDEAVRTLFPTPLTGQGAAGKAVVSVKPAFVTDFETDPDYSESLREKARVASVRSILAVPMIREGHAIGAISVSRAEPGQFSDHQITLLTTFADQAVIAIENVRLFNETKEALERQTATAEILKVISGSPTDVQPVFDAIVSSAARLFGRSARIRLAEDDHLVLRASSEDLETGAPMPIAGDNLGGRVFEQRRAQQIGDTEALDAPSGNVGRGRSVGYRALAAAPLMRDNAAIGLIGVMSPAPGALTDKQMELLQTFADQAVIAIENVRLFRELQSRTEALTKSVGQLTALGEVGQAISSTLDLETVLQAIVSRAVQLAGLDGGSIYEYDERTEEFRLQAAENMASELVAEVRRNPIRKGDGAVGHTAVTLEAAQVPDILEDSYKSARKEVLVRAGYRAILVVPLLRDDHLLGALLVNRDKPGRFPSEVVELLKTFATQSAMAIQNARLFREIADKGKQLEIASRHKSDFLANMSHELRTPLNAIIGFSEVLIERMFGELNEKQADYMKDIHESGRHLLSLINDILDLSKIEAGRMDLDIAAFDLPSSLANAMTLVRERAQRNGIELGLEVDPALGELHADERKVKQILLNLLSNAVKFTPQGGRVEVIATRQGDAVQIAVKDSGIGIAPEDHAAVFEEFKQVGSDYTRKAEGTGLGLALTKRFVELHGGEIRLESLPGVGSTFTFTLPVRT